REVAPALERRARAGRDGHQLGRKHDAAAADAVLAAHLVEALDALAHGDPALDHPVERAALQNLRRPARPHARDMARARVEPGGAALLDPAGLPCGQIVDRDRADAELEQMQHHPGPRTSVIVY